MNNFEEQLNKFILSEIIPKYDDILRFHCHNSSKLDLGVEFIFHVRFNMIKDELDALKKNLEFELINYYKSYGLEPQFMIILNTF